MTLTRIGRPIGSGADDGASLDAIEALRAAEPELSERAAIVRIAGDADSDIRRIQRKLVQRSQARKGDARLLMARPFDHEPPCATRDWGCHVGIPVDGDEGWGVTHSVVVGMPVLIVVRDGTPVGLPGIPDHPGLQAVHRLTSRHGWDDPSYRLCCERLGIDPDRERPERCPTYEEGVKGIWNRSWQGVDVTDPNEVWSVIEDGLAFEKSNGTYCPSSVARVYRTHAKGEGERSVQARKDAMEAFLQVEWPKSQAFTTLHWLAGPWGYDHLASIYFFGNERDGLGSTSAKPQIIAPPDEDDLVMRHAARLTERHCMAIVLSPAEMDAFTEGGDRGYWLGRTNAMVPRLAKMRGEAGRPDLSMTRRIVDAMVANAYAMHLARLAGETFAVDAPLSFETRVPIAASGTRPAWRAAWDAGRRMASEILGPGRGRFVVDGRVRIRGGDVFMGVDGDRIIVRPGARALYLRKGRATVTCTLIRSFQGRYVPLVTEEGFAVTDIGTGLPVASEEALQILGDLCWCASDLQAGLGHDFDVRILPKGMVLAIRAAGLLMAAVCGLSLLGTILG